MPVILDQMHWTQLEQVQVQVDRQVRYVTDMERFGVEDWWEPATDKGDCEDIVLTKRQRLMDMGWPADVLRIAVVLDQHHTLHAVLTVDVVSEQGKPGTYVLDSHFEHVEAWQYFSQYGYTWLERSKPGSTQWTRLDNGAPTATQQMVSLAKAIMPSSPRWSDVPAPVAPAAVTVTASVRLLSDDPQVEPARFTPASLDSNAEPLLIQAGLNTSAEASEGDDVTVGPAAVEVSRHGRHHGHGHGHGRSHGRRHTT